MERTNFDNFAVGVAQGFGLRERALNAWSNFTDRFTRVDLGKRHNFGKLGRAGALVTLATATGGIATGLEAATKVTKAFAQNLPEEPLLPLGVERLVRASNNNQYEAALIRAALVLEGECLERSTVVDNRTGEVWDFYDRAAEESCVQGPVTVSEYSQLVNGYPTKDFLFIEEKADNPYGFVIQRGVNSFQDRVLDLGYMQEGDCGEIKEGFFFNSRFQDQEDSGLNTTVYRHVVTKQPREVCYPPEIPQEAPRICVQEDNLVLKGGWYEANGQVGTAGDGIFYLPASAKYPNGLKFYTYDEGLGSEKTSHYTIVAFEDGDVLPPGQVIRYHATEGDANIWCANRDFDICNNLNQYLAVWDKDQKIAMIRMLLLKRDGTWDDIRIDAAPFRNQAYCENYDV